jgi:hypothetical protein
MTTAVSSASAHLEGEVVVAAQVEGQLVSRHRLEPAWLVLFRRRVSI